MQPKKNVIIISIAIGLVVVLGVGAWIVIARPFEVDQSKTQDNSQTETAPTGEQLLADGKYEEAKVAFEASLSKAKEANDEQKINYYTQQLDFLSNNKIDTGTVPPESNGPSTVIQGNEPQTVVQQ